MAAKKDRPMVKSAWANGSFYLFAVLIVLAAVGYLAGNLPLLALLAVIIATALLIPIIGALQLRQDNRLREKGFLELMWLVVSQLPLLGKIIQQKKP